MFRRSEKQLGTAFHKKEQLVEFLPGADHRRPGGKWKSKKRRLLLRQKCV